MQMIDLFFIAIGLIGLLALLILFIECLLFFWDNK